MKSRIPNPLDQHVIVSKMKQILKEEQNSFFTDKSNRVNPRGALKQLSENIFVDLDGVVFNRIMVDGQAAYMSKFRVCLERL